MATSQKWLVAGSSVPRVHYLHLATTPIFKHCPYIFQVLFKNVYFLNMSYDLNIKCEIFSHADYFHLIWLARLDQYSNKNFEEIIIICLVLGNYQEIRGYNWEYIFGHIPQKSKEPVSGFVGGIPLPTLDSRI